MNRGVWENLASLYSVHAFNYLVPLFTLPYLARVLGAAEWGAYAFADAYARIVAMAVEYGFGLSATREVARAKHDRAARSRELAGVLGAQLLLGFVGLLATLTLARTVPIFKTNGRLLPGAFFFAMSQGANPMWYFQGIERVKLMGGLWVAARVAGALGLFVFVRGHGDGWLALFIQGTAPFVSVVAGLAIAYREIPFHWPSPRLGWNALRSGGRLFLYRAGVSFYTSINVLILGLIAPPVMVAYYAGADKIAQAAASATAPITQIFYPRITYLLHTDRNGASRSARISLWLTMIVGCGVGVLLLLGAPLIVKAALGREFEGSVGVLRIFAAVPPLVAICNVFGVQWMLAFRLERELNRIVLAAAAVNVATCVVVARPFLQTGAAVSVVFAEGLIALGTFFTVRRRKFDLLGNLVAVDSTVG